MIRMKINDFKKLKLSGYMVNETGQWEKVKIGSKISGSCVVIIGNEPEQKKRKEISGWGACGAREESVSAMYEYCFWNGANFLVFDDVKSVVTEKRRIVISWGEKNKTSVPKRKVRAGFILGE